MLSPVRRRLFATLAVVAVIAASCSSGPSVQSQFSSPSMHPTAQPPPEAAVVGPLSSPGGPYLYDTDHRVVFLHGVNLVEKHPPYVLSITPGSPTSFTFADAQRIEHLGLNVVRLGVTWAGIEPGHGGINQPAVCTPGSPGDPGMWNSAAAAAYVAQVRAVIDLLARANLMVIVDMHQDVFAAAFRGEGAPPWAVW